MTNAYYTQEQYTAFQNYIVSYVQNKAKSLDLPVEEGVQAWAKKFRAYTRPEGRDPRRGIKLSVEVQNNAEVLTYTDFPLTLSQDNVT